MELHLGGGTVPGGDVDLRNRLAGEASIQGTITLSDTGSAHTRRHGRTEKLNPDHRIDLRDQPKERCGEEGELHEPDGGVGVGTVWYPSTSVAKVKPMLK